MPQVTVDEGDGKMGWLLLRASLHDPLLVLNVESELEGGDTLHFHYLACVILQPLQEQESLIDCDPRGSLYIVQC